MTYKLGLPWTILEVRAGFGLLVHNFSSAVALFHAVVLCPGDVLQDGSRCR